MTLRGGGGHGRDVKTYQYVCMARNVQITLLGILVCSKESFLYNNTLGCDVMKGGRGAGGGGGGGQNLMSQ